MFKKIKRWYHEIEDGIENIFVWIPIVWKDRDFDHAYLMDILIFKLEKMDKFFHSKYCMSDPDYEPTKTGYRKLRHAITLAKYLNSNKAFDITVSKHYDRFPISIDEFFEQINDETSDLNKKECKDDFHKETDKELKYNTMAKNKLFEILRDYYEYWWD